MSKTTSSGRTDGLPSKDIFEIQQDKEEATYQPAQARAT